MRDLGTGFTQAGDTARVSFTNGNSAEADIVIGADGIHSELRPYVFPPSTPVFSATSAYRGTVPIERVPDWPVERYYRDAKLLDIGAGTNEIRRMLIGREVIGL